MTKLTPAELAHLIMAFDSMTAERAETLIRQHDEEICEHVRQSQVGNVANVLKIPLIKLLRAWYDDTANASEPNTLGHAKNYVENWISQNRDLFREA